MNDKTLGEMIARRHLSFAEIDRNRELLDNCPGHRFGEVQLPIIENEPFVCSICNGRMKPIHAFRYIQGYEAAGGNPNDVLGGFKPDWKPAKPANAACILLAEMGYCWYPEFRKWLIPA